jgi:hypothetical protein
MSERNSLSFIGQCVLYLKGYDHDKFIPLTVSLKLQKLLDSVCGYFDGIDRAARAKNKAGA